MAERSVTLAPPGRPYEPGALLRWLYRRFFAALQVDAALDATVRQAAQRGTVVYVLRSLSFLDYACLNFFTQKLGLPALRFVNDLGQLPFRSLWRWIAYRLGRRRPEERELGEVVGAGQSALLFLKRPPHSYRAAPRGLAFPVDHIESLVGLQRTSERPILLVPHTFVWGKQPERRGRSLVDAVFGPQEWPGRVRMALQFLLNFRNAILRVGQPLDLAAFVAANVTEPNGVIASKVRFALLKRLERERRIILGPPVRSQDRVRAEVLRSVPVRTRIGEVARVEKKPLGAIEKRAKKLVREIEARMSYWVLVLLDRIFQVIRDRIFAGLDVDEEGLERVRDASRRGPLVLLPAHRSHVDYLVMSSTFFENNLAPPYIAAGINLSFFPLGTIFRHAGAFFLRRSLQGNALYAAVFKAYVRVLLRDGHPIEFFIEGTRSRTGRLLHPKSGLMAMIVDAACDLPQCRPQLVPASITYSRIIEEKSYLRELSGADKEPEGISSLFRTPKVLRARYGRLRLDFGEIIDLGTHLSEQRDEDAASEPGRRQIVQRLSHQVVYQIGRATSVTVSSLLATALLSHGRRGMERGRLVEEVGLLCRELEARGARFASAVLDRGTVRIDSLDEGMALFVEAGLVTRHGEGEDAIFQVPPSRRLALDYYKSNLLHHFVPSALVATALLAPGRPRDLAAVSERVEELSRLFKYEFVLRADVSFEEVLESTVDAMVQDGKVTRGADGVLGPNGDALALYASLLANFVEGCRLAARSLEVLVGRSAATSKKELCKRSLVLGEQMYLAGEIDRSEAISKPILENAFASFVDMGVLRGPRDRGPYRLAEPSGGTERPADLEARIAAYLLSAGGASPPPRTPPLRRSVRSLTPPE
ncbi:MAG: 1-acyl-sn-glycerol-3-phosphate acyltransferase [Deltaproteobacteria bacterium]|nr:1-acyl-sn-glycerol-3-phosphate acyltransferase [Deltaproteobacteria bacterium]